LSSPGRKSKNEVSNIGPGTYGISSSLDKLPQMTIQKKRENKVEVSPGPGDYSIEKADSLTHAKSVIIDLSSILGRPISKVDPNNGPGTYNIEPNFGSDIKKITIGLRRD
jgi:hypothetical protein